MSAVRDYRRVRQITEFTISEHHDAIRYHAQYLAMPGTQTAYHLDQIAQHVDEVERKLSQLRDVLVWEWTDDDPRVA